MAEAAMTRKLKIFEYTSHMEISAPIMKSIQYKGELRYREKNLLDAYIILIGVSEEPINAEGKYGYHEKTSIPTEKPLFKTTTRSFSVP